MRHTIAICLLIPFSLVLLAATPSEAPDFRLRDQNGEWHQLSDYRGRWIVLYFYPKAGSPACTTEACEFRDDIFRYRDIDVVLLGVSLDDVASQKEFAEKYHLPFPLLSDARQEVASRYGVLAHYGPIAVAVRETFVIDPGGRIVKHYDRVDPKTHSDQVLADLSNLLDGRG